MGAEVEGMMRTAPLLVERDVRDRLQGASWTGDDGVDKLRSADRPSVPAASWPGGSRSPRSAVHRGGLRIARDLESTGDSAVSIAERAHRRADQEPPLKPLRDLPRMADI